VQALIARIERLEQALGGRAPAPAPQPAQQGKADREPAASAGPDSSPPEPPRAGATPPERAMARAEAAAAVAASAVADSEPVNGLAIDLDHLQSLWPAAVEAVREENAMVGALLADARPAAIDGARLTIAFPDGAAFSKKKAENNRGLLAKALRDLTGESVELEYELGGGEGGAEGEADASSSLTEEQLLERLKEEFGATEVFDDEES
jgi:hypothetical protein